MRRVVVTGMGVVSPVGNTLKEYWENLVNGVCGIDYITKFDTTDYKVKIAAEVKGFDPLKYMDKSETRRTDLFCQYALCAAAQAVEESGFLSKINPDKVGVYVGSGIGGIATFISECEKLIEKGPSRISPFFIPMMIGNIAAGAISIKYKALGPTLPVVTACATSTHAIGEAYRAIKHGYADVIIAGGTEAAVTPLAIAGFTNCMALTTRNDPQNACIPFDKRRDGFVMGEGAAVLVLEEYECAKKRGAQIYAEICGYGNYSDAYHITAPDPEAFGITQAIKQAADEAQITVDEGLYINAHGTSTPLNDKIETIAFKNAFGEDAYKAVVGSTKSMTGHMLGAAGAAEAVACVMAIHTGMVPPTVGLKEPDPECDLNVNTTALRRNITKAISTSLGFGGHNACIAFKKLD
ncbi:MAG TPA: beta-ketoacyl-ACP synthase II [Clostridiales bacterium]|nr:beta-ketoacyl-ACP synthase II [Clostridiales bacterium]